MSAQHVSAQIADRFTPVVAPVGTGWVEMETLLSGAGTAHLDSLLGAVRRGGRTAGSKATAGSLVVLEFTRLLSRVCCLAFRRGESAPVYCGTCPVLDEQERLRRFHRAADRYVALTDTDGRNR